ncbi:CAIB/BAIF family enzyme [Myxozyma melibiosi]|uniref:CAIB/BAIF family enzyme n=1 Tax=Myxozyma melibiosi TaxID=54550 RepID=A0ABR1F321_9ASCO
MPSSISAEADSIFHNVLLTDSRLALPPSVLSAADRTTFDTDSIDAPFFPTPMKMSESSAALWALAATFANAITEQRFGVVQKVSVNTDAASLFLFSTAVVRVAGKTLQDPEIAKRYMIYDKGRSFDTYRRLATNIYPTKDGRFFHLHGSMNATPILTMLGLPIDRSVTMDQAIKDYISTVEQHDAEWLDIESNEHFRQAGTICLTPEEFARSEQGKAIKDDPIYLLESKPAPGLNPVPWPTTTSTSALRPLEGIKIIEIARVIAAPTISKLAALYGATVVRVSCLTEPDMGPLLVDGNLGKYDVSLDLKTLEGKKALDKLLEDADVLLDGYRPGALARLGYSEVYIHEIAKRRGKGIVYVRENCYGWKGPFKDRSGWQQISDCITGVSWLQGRFLGLNEPVVPLLPNSDYQVGIIGLIGILHALYNRTNSGESSTVSVSLNQFNLFYIGLGVQDDETQKSLREMHDASLSLRHFDDMPSLVQKTIMSLMKTTPKLFSPKHFAQIDAHLGGPEGEKMTFLGPVAKFEKTQLKYDVGSCFLNAYEAKWPEIE